MSEVLDGVPVRTDAKWTVVAFYCDDTETMMYSDDAGKAVREYTSYITIAARAQDTKRAQSLGPHVVKVCLIKRDEEGTITSYTDSGDYFTKCPYEDHQPSDNTE